MILPCERLFLNFVEFLEGLFWKKPLQSLRRGSEMARDAGCLEKAIRSHGCCYNVFEDARLITDN